MNNDDKMLLVLEITLKNVDEIVEFKTLNIVDEDTKITTPDEPCAENGKYGDDCKIVGPEKEIPGEETAVSKDLSKIFTDEKHWFPTGNWVAEANVLKFELKTGQPKNTYLTSRWIKRTNKKQQLTFEISQAPADAEIQLSYIKSGSKALKNVKSPVPLKVRQCV